MTYRVNCSIRNARGKEIAHRTPLWSGVAGDPKAAMLHGWAALKPIVDATPEADTIAIDVHGPKGLRVTATEYAEDFRIGYGASAVGSSALFADELGVSDMTEEQKAEAMKAFQARAVAALRPGLTPRTLDEDSLTEREKCQEKFPRRSKRFGFPLDENGNIIPEGELDRILKEFGAEIEDAQAYSWTPEENAKAVRETIARHIQEREQLEALHIAAAYREEINRREFRILHEEWARMKADHLAVGGMGKMFLVQPDGSQKYIGDVKDFTMEAQ